MSKPTAVVFCPGRGAYGRDELGFISRNRRDGAVADALVKADAERDADDSITAIDGAERFRPGLHLKGANAAELIYFSTMFHLEALRERYRIVAVAGNSLGWYTALAGSGALDPTEGWRLVRSMALMQADVTGGQVLTTTVDAEWFTDEDARAELAAAVVSVSAQGPEFFVSTSIRLGGHVVLGGTAQGVTALLEALPKRKVGDREFPFQLAGNGPFHTPLCDDVSMRAQDGLRDLAIGMPETHLIDGLGNVHSPWSTSPDELWGYTLHTQVVDTFDFTATVRTAMREFNPEVLLCAGPGSSLRAPVGHVVLAEGFGDRHTRDDLFASNLVRID